jgi:hypothetical protein
MNIIIAIIIIIIAMINTIIIIIMAIIGIRIYTLICHDHIYPLFYHHDHNRHRYEHQYIIDATNVLMMMLVIVDVS